MSSIVEQIEKEIANYEAGVVKKNVGRIVSIADGVAKLEGLRTIFLQANQPGYAILSICIFH